MTDKKFDYKTRMGIKNCIFLLGIQDWSNLTDDEKIHTAETLVMLRELREIGEKPGPAHLREEVSPQEWKEPSSTGAEKGGQR
ncbi:MAG: hypothetical protein ACXAEN_20840 [Candidatus Thorarchaeota archaeon]|jgi:hypothetical protein